MTPEQARQEAVERIARQLYLDAHPGDEWAERHWDVGGAQHVNYEPWLERARRLAAMLPPVQVQPVQDAAGVRLWIHVSCAATAWSPDSPEYCDGCRMRTDRWELLHLAGTKAPQVVGDRAGASRVAHEQDTPPER